MKKRNYKIEYADGKERARNEAIEWSLTFCEHNYSYGELAVWSDYFTRLGKKYGLMREFHENAIC